MAAVLLAGGLAAGCAALVGGDRPAVLAQATAPVQAQLQQVLATALQVPSVMIAADALTRSSTLVIDSEQLHQPGQRLNGRVRSRPDRFQLLRAGARCVLLHERTGQRHALPGVQCVPVDDGRAVTG